MEREAFSVPEVAQKLGVSPSHVRQLIKRGELQAIYVGRLLRVTAEDLQRYLRGEKGGAGR